MAINPPHISGPTTVQRKLIVEQPVSVNYSYPSAPPSYEGQLYVYLKLVDDWREGEMYVGTYIEGVLWWVRGDVSEYVHAYTGEPWSSFPTPA